MKTTHCWLEQKLDQSFFAFFKEMGQINFLAICFTKVGPIGGKPVGSSLNRNLKSQNKAIESQRMKATHFIWRRPLAKRWPHSGLRTHPVSSCRPPSRCRLDPSGRRRSWREALLSEVSATTPAECRNSNPDHFWQDLLEEQKPFRTDTNFESEQEVLIKASYSKLLYNRPRQLSR